MLSHARCFAPLVSGHAGMKFTVLETLDHIKEEFQLFQAQYHSLKLECEKLASEKTEMHRHYIMVRVKSNNITHNTKKIVKRLSQQQFQHLSHHAPGFPLTPHPSGLNLGAGASLMALPGAFPFPPHLAPKDDITHSEPLDSRGVWESISGSGSPVGHRSAGLRLGLPPPPPSSFSSSHADMDNKRGGPDQTSTGRTRRESGGKSEDALRRDGTKEKSASPAGVSPRSTEGNGLNSSPVLRKNPSREGSSSPQSQPHSPGLCRSPTQEKVRSPSPSASHDSLSPGSPAPLSSSARGPSPALKHFLTQLPPFLKINLY
uniref:TLE family member 2, transcriptional corepressor c n=1 Tax=Sinocyclocheilus anshuiensis TaxID=1608454 RepID=A0A671K628_9TELE